jgi:hypothetical protein
MRRRGDKVQDLLDTATVVMTACAVFSLVCGFDLDALLAAGAGFTCLLIDDVRSDLGR